MINIVQVIQSSTILMPNKQGAQLPLREQDVRVYKNSTHSSLAGPF